MFKKQINILSMEYNFNKILIAYEPIWSIGTGVVPKSNELNKIAFLIKNHLEPNSNSLNLQNFFMVAQLMTKL